MDNQKNAGEVYKNVVDAWNKQSDEFNSWDNLSEEEKIVFAFGCDKWKNLYHAVNKMMIKLGAEGEIRPRNTEPEEVMDALYLIDGGVYNDKM
jgi:hypothetical protein